MSITRGLAVLVFLLSSGLLFAQDDAAKKELEKFAGKWKPVEIKMPECMPAPPADELKQMRFVFKEDTMTLWRGEEEGTSATITLNPEKKHIDLKATSRGKGKMVGIYEFKDGKLRLCLVGPPDEKERPRPTSFEAKKLDDGEQALVVLEKAKD